MFDKLQSDLDQRHKKFSRHLWHFAAGRPDDANHAYLHSSSTLYSITWETLPAELKKVSAVMAMQSLADISILHWQRDINCSMILARSSPKFSKLFSAVGTIRSTSRPLFSPFSIQQISDAPITPWFPIHPHHTIHLSGFVFSTRPGGNAPVHSSL